MSATKKVVQYAAGAAVILLFLGVAAWFTVPRYLGLQGEVVLSGSMEPALPVGSVVFVSHTRPSGIRVGDIMMFGHPLLPPEQHVLVTHRVTQVVTDAQGNLAFKTQGDANGAEDDWTVPAGYVLGRAEHDMPYVGLVTGRLRTPLGLVLLIVVPATILAAGEVRRLARAVRQRRNETLPSEAA